MNEQQRNFENFADEIIRIASCILHEGEDLNSLELQLEKIETLHSITILRRRIELNLPNDLAYTNISNDDLDNEIRNIQREQPFSGQIIIAGVLCSRGIRVHRQRLHESLNRVDAWGMHLKTIKYNLARGNKDLFFFEISSVYGLYQNEELLILSGVGIDGYSQMITFCNCSSNNKSITVLTQFQKGIEQFGIPSRVRADHGGENALVKQFMERYRGYGCGSFIAGRSVHNQRIERLCGDINRCVLKIYKTIFLYLEENFELDIDNNTPLQLFTSGMIECGYRGMEDFNVNELYGIDWEGPIPSNSDDNAAAVVVEDPRNVLNQNEYHELLNSVGIDREDNNYGINVYLDT
ncbi:4339_t:CDS:2 [Entrophospora sp. SA101]|nr:20129_t:CDS:2 [Entrophospora sp. SA101]CAJ0826162.1 20131_t:CDS:2 [Entrophospora sp. SA101]CAJ0865399.1 4339_t:CDS:2 [Entrophospora sp. SA101]